jgi:DNA polymerase-3 subunit delta'
VLFSKVVGHAKLKAKLIGNIREGRVAHAQLFMGPRGCGNLPLALAYAQYLLCERPDVADACGQCPSCLQADKLEHPDLHLAFPIFFAEKKPRVCDYYLPKWRDAVLKENYIDLDRWRDQLNSENKQVRMGVDIAQEIQAKLNLKAFRGGYKVVIIWLPETMDTAATNKLLKVLEEPQPNTVCLLVSNDPDQLLPTILSRTQLVRVPALRPSEVGEVLRERFPELSEEEARTIALRSEGDLLEALTIAAQGEEELFVFFRDWLRHCYGKQVGAVADFAEHFQKMGREKQKALMRYGLYLIRQSVFEWQQVPELVRAYGLEHEFVQKFSGLLSDRSAEGIRQELETAHVHIERNAHPKMLFMDLSYRIMGLLRPVK